MHSINVCHNDISRLVRSNSSYYRKTARSKQADRPYFLTVLLCTAFQWQPVQVLGEYLPTVYWPSAGCARCGEGQVGRSAAAAERDGAHHRRSAAAAGRTACHCRQRAILCRSCLSRTFD